MASSGNQTVDNTTYRVDKLGDQVSRFLDMEKKGLLIMQSKGRILLNVCLVLTELKFAGKMNLSALYEGTPKERNGIHWD